MILRQHLTYPILYLKKKKKFNKKRKVSDLLYFSLSLILFYQFKYKKRKALIYSIAYCIHPIPYIYKKLFWLILFKYFTHPFGIKYFNTHIYMHILKFFWSILYQHLTHPVLQLCLCVYIYIYIYIYILIYPILLL